MSFYLNDIKLKHDVPFIHNGVKYPANWLRLTTLDEKQVIGIREEPEPFKGA